VKVSIDLDGTFYAHTAFFVAMATAMQAAGHEVGILTGHGVASEGHVRERCAGYGFNPDFYLGRTAEYVGLNGSYFKRDMIREHAIDYHFDDHDYDNEDSRAIIAASGPDTYNRIFIAPHASWRRWINGQLTPREDG